MLICKVVATTGIDIVAKSEAVENPEKQLSFLENPVDVEFLFTLNPASMFDFSRAKVEAIVKISPLQILLSEVRLSMLSQIVLEALSQSTLERQTPLESPSLPPRLDALSGFALFSADVSMSRVRLRVLSQDKRMEPPSLSIRKQRMEECLDDFLSVVSSFDLSFPHEEALSAAMQICIDRVAGVGLLPEEAWNVANLALLNFLEEVAAIGETVSRDEDGELQGAEEDDEFRNAKWNSVERTIAEYTGVLETYEIEDSVDREDVVLDFTDGVSLSLVRLFYDDHMNIVAPTLFVANGEGMHLVRVTPSRPPKESGSSFGSESDQSEDLTSEPDQIEENPETELSFSALVCHCLAMDSQIPFGRGGQPLAVLGSDTELTKSSEARAREQLVDVEVGEVEVCVCRKLSSKILSVVAKAFMPVLESSFFQTRSPDPRSYPNPIDSHLLGVTNLVSVLLTSDSYTPFSVAALSGTVAKCHIFPSPISKEVQAFDFSANAESVELLSLSPESELHSSLMSVLPANLVPTSSEPGRKPMHMSTRYTSALGEGLVEVVLSSLRIVLLRRFVNEALQYFFSEKYGILCELRKLFGSTGTESGQSSSMRWKISLLDSSVLVPRSSSSSDMVAFESQAVTVDFDSMLASFSMPTKSSRFHRGKPVFEDGGTSEFVDCQSFFPGSETGTNCNREHISRMTFGLASVGIFASLPEMPDGEPSPDNRSFNYFYEIDGRADDDKAVYCPKGVVPITPSSDKFSRENSVKLRRCWRRISEEATIDVIVDYAPHCRVLITNPQNGSFGELSLDVRLTQFCLLLSLWYSNMKEVPRMFPYSAVELQASAIDVADQFDFPDYGTEGMKSLLLKVMPLSSEICIVLDKLSLRSTFDCLDDERRLMGERLGIVVAFDRPVVHVSYDEQGVCRIGAGSATASLTDESLVFERVLQVHSAKDADEPWANLGFGLDRESGLTGEENLPFQMSLFMLPSWTLYNVGMRSPEITLSDFGPLFRWLRFLGSYFSDPKLGNPVLAARDAVENLKSSLRNALSMQGDETDSSENDVMGMDFRLWLLSPSLDVPCDGADRSAPNLCIWGDGGLWYRYTYFDEISYQECVSDGLSLAFCENSLVRGAGRIRTLVEALSFGMRMDCNGSSNHTDYSVSIPFDSQTACGFTSERVSGQPRVVVLPTICSPIDPPHRKLGARVSEVTCIVELFPAVSTPLVNLFSGNAESATEESSGNVEPPSADEAESSQLADAEKAATFSLVASVRDLRLLALDPILGPHLPVAVLSVASVRVTASQFSVAPRTDVILAGESAPEDIQVVVDGHFWADYFKLGITRSWEPLMEPFIFSVLLEKSRLRGSGMSLNAESPLHFNVSGAFLVIFNQVFEVYHKLILETFSDDSSSVGQNVSVAKEPESLCSVTDSSGGMVLVHEKPSTIEAADRVAFNLKNLSGQKLRIFQSDPSQQSAIVKYLEHNRAVQLTFQPSVSTIYNLGVRDVDFPGFSQKGDEVVSPSVDLQIPGCEWLRGLEVNTFGRSFSSITPLSAALRRKVEQDWRLANLMNILVEVGLHNGGRQVTVRSLFSVVNKTTHAVTVLCHPGPSFSPTDLLRDGSEGGQQAQRQYEDAIVEPGDSYHLPILLLRDALQRDGNHLGSMWLKPSNVCQALNIEASASSSSEDLSIDFSSRSAPLAKIVDESSVLFDVARGQDVGPEAAKTGMQVSCPVVRTSGDRLAPFCYALEVGRSPLVEARTHVVGSNEKQKHVHGPVSYTISIHAPFVIVNLLPERGRFELMHAVRRKVLWFADLDPGEQISIHSVGLDAPLLLLVNVGFCRTPVGEGALVHHGPDPPPGTRGETCSLQCAFAGPDLVPLTTSL